MKKILFWFKIVFSVLVLDILLLVLAIFWPSKVSYTIKRVAREVTKRKKK